VWEKVGKFDECFEGGYVEDCAYHVRMHRAGVYAYTIGIPFYHVGAGTIKNASPKEAKEISERAHNNREVFKGMYGCYPGTIEYYKLFEVQS